MGNEAGEPSRASRRGRELLSGSQERSCTKDPPTPTPPLCVLGKHLAQRGSVKFPHVVTIIKKPLKALCGAKAEGAAEGRTGATVSLSGEEGRGRGGKPRT